MIVCTMSDCLTTSVVVVMSLSNWISVKCKRIADIPSVTGLLIWFAQPVKKWEVTVWSKAVVFSLFILLTSFYIMTSYGCLWLLHFFFLFYSWFIIIFGVVFCCWSLSTKHFVVVFYDISSHRPRVIKAITPHLIRFSDPHGDMLILVGVMIKCRTFFFCA